MTADRLVAARPDMPPSRDSNPFATCWTRPGALPFIFPNGLTAETIVARLAANNWRGALVGPHGSGKSTLLETLRPVLASAGRRVHTITLRNRECRLPPGFLPRRSAECHDLLIVIDGYEQLAWLERVWLNRRCRHAGAGLLVTTHEPVRLPTLITLAPDVALVEQLATTLCRRWPYSISATDIAASHACHGGNVREIFFDLYDSFERRRVPN